MSDHLIVVADAEGRLSGDLGAPPVAWWSFTKPLIAVAALRLAETCRIDLEAALPGRPYGLRHLLGHTAGLGDYGGLAAYREAAARADPPWSDDELFAHLPQDRLAHPPGAGWAYSNLGYLLVRRALEAATGTGLGRLLRDLVLDPLGLVRARLAETAADFADLAFPVPSGYDPGWVFHGAVVGPAEEAVVALARILDGDLPSPAARAELVARRPLDPAIAAPPWVDPGYGLGLMIGAMADPDTGARLEVVGHSAGGPGSVGAVYATCNGRRRTVACFRAGEDGGRAEREVACRLASHR
jgi:CubicO group peptidase (beta-lactamase class C family)